MHLSHQGPVLVDGGPRLWSQVQERAGADATAPADPLDDLGVGVGQLRQRASQLLLVSAGVITSAGAGHEATHPLFNPGLCPPGKSVSSVCRDGRGGLLFSKGVAPLNLRHLEPGSHLRPGLPRGSYPLRSGHKAAWLLPQIRAPRVGPCLSLHPLPYNQPHPLYFCTQTHPQPHTLLHQDRHMSDSAVTTTPSTSSQLAG